MILKCIIYLSLHFCQSTSEMSKNSKMLWKGKHLTTFDMNVMVYENKIKSYLCYRDYLHIENRGSIFLCWIFEFHYHLNFIVSFIFSSIKSGYWWVGSEA